MKIRLNGLDYETVATDLASLKEEFANSVGTLNGAQILTIYKGFSVNENLSLNEGDSVVFIKKGEMPDFNALKEMMRSRNSPQINEALDSAKIGVAGLGGLGSSVAIALARVGVSYLKLADFDTVDPSNLNRQQYFISDIGRLKTEALKDIIAKINPFVSVEIASVRLDESNINEVFSRCDIVAECFDNPQSKAMLINSLKNRQIVAASGMAGWGRSEEIKTHKFAKNLFVCGDLKDAAAIGNGLMAPRVGVCAMHQANKILELLINQI